MKKTKKTYKELALNFKNTKSEKAFYELYKKMKPGLWNYVYKIIKDSDLADDITSTTLATVYFKIDQYDESYQITTWAYRIAFNSCLGHIRNNNKKVNMDFFLDKGYEPTTSSGRLLFQDSLIADELYMSNEDLHIEAEKILMARFNTTLTAIKELPPMYKDYMEERFINGKSYNDILEIMSKKESNISLQTVKNRIFRGRTIIKNQLKDTELFSMDKTELLCSI